MYFYDIFVSMSDSVTFKYGIVDIQINVIMSISQCVTELAKVNIVPL